jgi:hypothetical protein
MSKITEQEERWQSLEAFVAACESAAKITENNVGVSDAIEFAEWIKKNEWDLLAADETKWIQFETQRIIDSTEELYKIFQESQLQQKEV